MDEERTETVTYFTFGVQYSREAHPTHDAYAHPDGWWEVHGVSHEEARRLVNEMTNGHWAFDYDEKDFDRSWHPMGCLLTIEKDGTVRAGEPMKWSKQ